MASAKSIAAVAVAITVAAVFIGPIASVVGANTGSQTVTNESVTADVGNYVDLGGYNIDSGSETVYWLNSSSGSYEQVSSSTDYTMAYQNGSIRADSGGTIGDGDSLKVTYTYAASGGLTSTILGYSPLFIALILLAVMYGEMEGMM